MHKEMSRAMKQIKKMGGLKGLASMFGGGGGLPGMGGGMGGGGGMPGLPGMGGGSKGPSVDPDTLPPDLQELLKKQ
jgi:signal recognition particle subunit SRP54